MANETEQDATRAPKSDTAVAKRPRARAKKAKPRTKRAVKRKPAPRTRAKASRPVRKTPAKPARKTRARRENTPAAEQARIVSTANREGLTALQVQKRFGVKPVTYYSWRKKLGLKGPRGRRSAGAVRAQGSDLSAQVRAGVQARVREMLPSIVREDVGRYLDQVLGGRSDARGRRGR